MRAETQPENPVKVISTVLLSLSLRAIQNRRVYLQMNDALLDVLGDEYGGETFDFFLVHGFAQVLLGLESVFTAHGEIP